MIEQLKQQQSYLRKVIIVQAAIIVGVFTVAVFSTLAGVAIALALICYGIVPFILAYLKNRSILNDPLLYLAAIQDEFGNQQ